MAWPARTELWAERFSEVKQDYATVAKTIACYEPVFMVARPAQAEEAGALCGPTVTVIQGEIDDSWMRDSGPTFLRGTKAGLAIADWGFNAWGGKYEPHSADAALKRRIAEYLGLPLVSTGLVAEGGAILSDGDGTILTTESCLLNPNRNPGMTRDEVEQELLASLSADKVIWLPGDPAEVETDGHVDCLACIVAPGRVMMADPRTATGEMRAMIEANRAALAAQTDARDRPFEILDIPAAPRIDSRDPRHQSCYINFYIANGAVIMAGHGLPCDESARRAVAAAFPTREVIQLNLGALPYGGGSIHCITQHQPMANRTSALDAGL
jgi:agmatine deiminase